jgi:starch synthase
MIGSEALPFAKTGGLADVLGALPSALGRLGWDVRVSLPRYRGVTLGERIDRFRLKLGGSVNDVELYEVPVAERVHALLVDVPELFDREFLYGDGSIDYPDNARRFAVLVRAVLDHAGRLGQGPSVVHAHDWQAGLAPVYLKTYYAAHPVLCGTPSVFTIHNLAYQGVFEPDWLPRLDLPWELLSIDSMEFWGRISLLKGGINYADVVTTVSPTYAEEIQTPEQGSGFDGILRDRSADLVGVLNGIDSALWDPACDRFVGASFSAADLSGKREAKRELLECFGLPIAAEVLERPLVGMISRMVDQKGFDLLAAAADQLATLDATFVMLGTGEPQYQDLWRRLAKSYPDRIGTHIGFDERRAHLIEAGSDMFLMPSRFEPCGLNQLYSLRYGTVPVVRAVGGLRDTIDASVGFLFYDYSTEALVETLSRALACYRQPRAWRALQRAGMKRDHSWDRSAAKYVKLYHRAMRIRKGAVAARPRPIRAREASRRTRRHDGG